MAKTKKGTPPKKSTERRKRATLYPEVMSVSLETWAKAELVSEARAHGVTPSQWLREVIMAHLNGEEKMGEAASSETDADTASPPPG